MERLLPVMFWDYFDDAVWIGLKSHDYHIIFNPMQHLLIHLPFEAKVGGHVRYR
jgi:hypothetical protein